MLDALRSLTTGEGAALVKIVEDNVSYFCPFEALGMAHQEIRHSHFLAYALDPNRPHGLGSSILDALLDGLNGASAGAGATNHIRDTDDVRVFRERDRIDILVEIRRADARNTVIAIEMKIWAGEGRGQLERYEQKIRKRYPKDRWDYLLCFLTPRGREPETSGKIEWASMSFDNLFDHVCPRLAKLGADEPGVKLFGNYVTMMRRTNVAKRIPNKELAEAVGQIWAKHREALKYLFDNEPKPLNDLMSRLREDGEGMATYLSEAVGEKVALDSVIGQYVRFSFPGLIEAYPGLGTGRRDWLASGSQLNIELIDNIDLGAITICFGVTGWGIDGSGEKFRHEFIRQMNNASNEAHKIEKRVQHYFERNLMDERESGSDDDSYNLLKRKLVAYLKEHLPAVREAIERTQQVWSGS